MNGKGAYKIGLSDVFIGATILVTSLLCLIPILNTVAMSLSDKTDAAVGRVFIWPVHFTTAPYEQIWKEKQFFLSFFNSVRRVLLGGTINVILATLTAFPISRSKSKFRQRNVYLWYIIFTMIFYGGLVPNFMLVRSLGLMDTNWALVLPTAVPAFSIIILMNFFREIPVSLEESAYMDGAGPFYVLWKIFVPLAKPAIATIALISIVFHWNTFFDGVIYINTPSKLPLQTYIQSLTATITQAEMQSLQPEEIMKRMLMSDLTFNCAKVVVSMLPVLLIYPFLQKYFVTGMVLGAVKE